MRWERAGGYGLLRCGPWRIARFIVGGAPRYCLTRDGEGAYWCGVWLARARYFDSSAAAKQVAQDETNEEQGAEDGADR